MRRGTRVTHGLLLSVNTRHVAARSQCQPLPLSCPLLVCVPVNSRVFIRMRVHGRASVWRPEFSAGCLQPVFTLVFETRSLTEAELNDWLANPRDPLCLCLPVPGVQSSVTGPSVQMWMLGI